MYFSVFVVFLYFEIDALRCTKNKGSQGKAILITSFGCAQHFVALEQQHESQVLQLRAIIRIPSQRSDSARILLWEFLFESFGAINSIKMQFEGFVILNNAKTVLG